MGYNPQRNLLAAMGGDGITYHLFRLDPNSVKSGTTVKLCRKSKEWYNGLGNLTLCPYAEEENQHFPYFFQN